MGWTVGARPCVLAACALLLAPGGLRAQTYAAAPSAAPPSREELNPAAQVRLAPPAPDLFSAPVAGACPLAENPAALTVTSVTFRGLKSVPAQDLAPAYADILGKAADAAVLCRIRDGAAEILFDRGLLARVEIPAQTIRDGAVILEVIEAHIVNVTVRGDPGPAAPAVERYARKLRGMAPFDVNRVQRYILLASDLPGLTVKASVRPNLAGERGAVDMDLTVQRDPRDLIAAFSDQAIQARTDLADFNVLYFATHGLLPQPEACVPEPALVTSLGGGDSDALLDSSEILNLDLDADLVVLAACDTGGAGATVDRTGLTGGGEALGGLTRAMIYAGARTLVVSHWSIDSASAVRLMTGFFAPGSGSMADAMRRSQAALQRDPQFAHPFFWAPFTVIGDGARPPPSAVGGRALAARR